MIFIFTALYPEAKPLIRMLGLRKRAGQTHYQQFISEDEAFVLSLTGVGAMNAAIVTSSVLTEYAAGPGDQLLSFGTAAAVYAGFVPAPSEHAALSGEMYHIHRITEQWTKRDFYPDMLLRTELPEASLMTGAKLLPAAASDVRSEGPAPFLYDMEGSAVYQAAALFLGPHQMNFIRVVTDGGLTPQQTEDPRQLSEHVTGCIETQEAALKLLLQRLIAWKSDASDLSDAQILTEDAERCIQKLTEDAHFSSTMADALRQLLRYAVLSRIDWQKAVQKLYDEQLLPTRDKRAGKELLRRLQSELLYE